MIAESRLDNRQELVAQFKMDYRFIDPAHDAELAIELYQRYGKACTNYLLGKFLIIDYNIQERQLRLIQDQCDDNALYYYNSDAIFVFASTLQQLLAHPMVPKRLDFDKVIDTEAVIIGRDRDGTIYKDIKLLNPAHILEVGPKHFRKERYWFPEQIEIDHSINFEDAAEQMRSLFFDAVRARIKTPGGVASMMSGGLDSGSVANVAAKLLANESKTLHTYSHVPLYDLSNLHIPENRFGDERPNIQASLAQHDNVTPHFMDSAGVGILEGLRNVLKVMHTPMHGVVNAFWGSDIYNHVQQNGHSVLLAGGMGNATISFSGYLPAPGFRKLSPLKAVKKLLRPAYYTLKSRNKPPMQWKVYSYLNATYFDQYDLKSRIEASGRNVDKTKRQFDSHRDAMLAILRIGYQGRLRGLHENGTYYSFAFRDPTTDRRIIEFLLSLPNSHFINDKGESKLLIKKAMKGILPDKVLFQKGKGLQSADIMMRVQSDIPEIESIITNFKTDFYDGELYDKARLLNDLALLKKLELTPNQIHHLLRSVGIMEFLNSYS